MKVALIGPTGYVGRAVLDELLARGHEVLALARDPAKLAARPGLTVRQADVRDPAQVAAALAGAEALVSAYNPGWGVAELYDEFLAGNVRDAGGFTSVWRQSELFSSLREPDNPGACASCGSYDACQGGCMASKFFVGLELTDPDPECVLGNAEPLLEAIGARTASGVHQVPTSTVDHSRPGVPVPSPVSFKPTRRARA